GLARRLARRGRALGKRRRALEAHRMGRAARARRRRPRRSRGARRRRARPAARRALAGEHPARREPRARPGTALCLRRVSEEMNMLTRRKLIAASAQLTLLAPFARCASAATGADPRFVLVVLRGGLDGLAAVPPYGDPQYASARGDLALGPPGT